MILFQGESPAAETQFKDLANSAGDDVSTTLDRLKSGDVDTFMPLLDKYLIPAVGALLLIIVAFMAAKYIARLVSAPVRKRVDETLGRFVGNMVYYAIMISALIAVMGYFGLEVTSFAAILASAGFAVGMAFQGTLSNFSAGIMLLVFRPFKVGDVINAAGVTARVNEIDLFTTTLDTPDNRRIIVPNTAITAGTIENISHHSERRVDVTVGCDYGADLQQTRTVLESAVESVRDRMLTADNRGYQVVLGDLGDSAVTWTVRVWTQADEFWGVKETLTAAVKDRLDEAGIGIPYPQVEIHLAGGQSLPGT